MVCCSGSAHNVTARSSARLVVCTSYSKLLHKQRVSKSRTAVHNLQPPAELPPVLAPLAMRLQQQYYPMLHRERALQGKHGTQALKGSSQTPHAYLLSATRARFLMPAVSMSVSCCPPGSVMVVSTASRVVPLMSHTMARSSPQMAFSKLLLPAGNRGSGVESCQCWRLSTSGGSLGHLQCMHSLHVLL